MKEEKEKYVVKYTRIIHPEDLGTPTSILENALREMLENYSRSLIEAEIERLEGKIEYEVVKEIWCPKQNVLIKEYWSHHDESLHCQNCGSKVEVREKKSVKNNWEQYEEINDQISHLKELLTNK